ncbi:unnamed protein product [Moneuplotes crassus]|uniref:Uncharacterized protein n=1 Tax=Euplotes crassus TaxID=5936 RepID=A0AAD1XTR2_EUPCR|nr:unnamed protein product [Moneuplotes crassus]
MEDLRDKENNLLKEDVELDFAIHLGNKCNIFNPRKFTGKEIYFDRLSILRVLSMSIPRPLYSINKVKTCTIINYEATQTHLSIINVAHKSKGNISLTREFDYDYRPQPRSPFIPINIKKFWPPSSACFFYSLKITQSNFIKLFFALQSVAKLSFHKCSFGEVIRSPNIITQLNNTKLNFLMCTDFKALQFSSNIKVFSSILRFVKNTSLSERINSLKVVPFKDKEQLRDLVISHGLEHIKFLYGTTIVNENTLEI